MSKTLDLAKGIANDKGCYAKAAMTRERVLDQSLKTFSLLLMLYHDNKLQCLSLTKH
jgi:hypothetical protein